MIKIHFRLAYRNLKRQKLYSLINIGGLAIAITSCLFILIYVSDELSFDRFHSNAENIYHIRHNYFLGDEEYDWAETSPLLAEKMRNHFSQVESVTSITAPGNYAFRHKQKLLGDIQTIQADAYFFSVFDFSLLAGDRLTALSESADVIISEDIAQRFFQEELKTGNYDVLIGKTLISNGDLFTIKGVLANLPHNSHLQFDVVVSIYDRLKSEYVSTTWLPAGIHHYAVLRDKVSLASLEELFTEVEKEHLWPEMQQKLGAPLSVLESNTQKYGYKLESLLDIHLVREGNLKYVYVFSAIGFIILVLGIINFVNLYTARIAKRGKEVGVRKVLGSSKKNLVGQFLMEAFLMCLISTLIALGLIQLFIQQFNSLSGKNIVLNIWHHPINGIYLAGFILFITLLAGVYPAIVFSSFKPVNVLKGNAFKGIGKEFFSLRSSLIVFQFFISTVLIVSSFGLHQQLEYMQQKDHGFNKDQVLVLSDAYSLGANKEVFKKGLLSNPAVKSVSFSYAVPSSTFDWLALYQRKGEDREHQFYVMEADFDYIPTFGFSMVEGRAFSEEFPADSSSIILNEVAARQLGIDGLVGSELTNHFDEKFKVIGIIKDFNFEHLKNEIKPLAITLNSKNSFSLFASVKIQTSNPQETVEEIKAQWETYNSEAPFSYSFLNEKFNAQFKAEVQTGNLIRIFTGLAIAIACLGLFGLSVYTAEQKTKEIGIRKVLGASVKSITFLLSKEFLGLVLGGFLIATPFAFFLLHKWFQDFANRVTIKPEIFVFSGLLIVGIALLTVCFQSIRAALANPVDSLKNE